MCMLPTYSMLYTVYSILYSTYMVDSTLYTVYSTLYNCTTSIAYYIYVLTCRHFPSLLHSSPVVDLCEWRPHELTSSAVEVIGQLTRDTDITGELKYVALPYNLRTVQYVL